MKTIENEQTFLITKEYKKFKEFCDACKKYKYIGLCYGPPGIGKTLSAKYYSSWNLIDNLHCSKKDMFANPSITFPENMPQIDTVYYAAEVHNTPLRIKYSLREEIRKLYTIQAELGYHKLNIKEDQYSKDILESMKSYVLITHEKMADLLIVDEVDRLKMASIEHLRDFYDRSNWGVVLVGMPGLEKRLSRYPQLYSRIGFIHEFKPLSSAEIVEIINNDLKNLGFNIDVELTNEEALAAIVTITRGNFRLLCRLFQQIERILKLNNTQTITKEIVIAARGCLVIGV
jgi:DNA transposition AAA+ family ATPase